MQHYSESPALMNSDFCPGSCRYLKNKQTHNPHPPKLVCSFCLVSLYNQALPATKNITVSAIAITSSYMYY